jgi:hypothetical protein
MSKIVVGLCIILRRQVSRRRAEALKYSTACWKGVTCARAAEFEASTHDEASEHGVALDIPLLRLHAVYPVHPVQSASKHHANNDASPAGDIWQEYFFSDSHIRFAIA